MEVNGGAAAAIASVPNGARFYKCALHVNPFEYLARTNRIDPSLPDEPSYNAAFVDACIETGVEVIAVTDHYRVKGSLSLMKAAADAGLVVLPGFEAVTKDHGKSEVAFKSLLNQYYQHCGPSVIPS